MGFHRSLSPEIRVHDLFVDRSAESEALKKSLEAHRRGLCQGNATCPMATNVLVFHGIGGIGKSTLSRRLESWVKGLLEPSDSWGAAPEVSELIVARYDLRDSKGQVDPAAVVLSLRRALNVCQKKWPAFDIAFAAWWNSVHRDGTMPYFKNNRTDKVTESIFSSIADLASDLNISEFVGGVTARGLHRILEVLIKAETRISAFETVGDGEAFKDLLNRLQVLPSPDDPRIDLLIELVALLDVEIGKYANPPTILMFIDTFENVQVRNDFERTAERFFNELIWSLPHVLFVITGRNALDWGRPDGFPFRYRGPRLWPGLAEGASNEPRQHLVGFLSEPDSITLLKNAVEENELLIDDSDIIKIAKHAHGHPKHLDLILKELWQRKAAGIQGYDREILATTFDELVMRLLRDLSAEEQGIIRSAALFTSFDVELLANVSRVRAGAVLRALRSPLIDVDCAGRYRLHESVRVAIRNAAPSIEGGWAELDWQSVASRGLSFYREGIRKAMQESDRQSMLNLTGAAISLVASEDVTAGGPCVSKTYDDWLNEALVMGPGFTPLRNNIPSVSTTGYGQSFIDFIVAKDLGVPFDVRCALLSNLSKTDFPISRTAKRHLAYALRSRNEFARAINLFDDLIEQAHLEVDLFQRQYTVYQSRKFDDVLKSAAGLPPHRIERLWALIELSHGYPEAYLKITPPRIAKLREEGRMREADEAQGVLDKYTVLCSQSLPKRYIDEALDNAFSYVGSNAQRGLLTLYILNDPFSSKGGEYVERLEQFDNVLGRKSSYRMMARIASAYANEDFATLSRCADELDTIDHSSTPWIPIEALLHALGFQVDIPSTEWVEPYEVVKDRWLAIWEAWKNRVAIER